MVSDTRPPSPFGAILNAVIGRLRPKEHTTAPNLYLRHRALWTAALFAPLLLAACYQQAPQGNTITTSSQPQGISVVGDGRITVVPDVAVVQLGVDVTASGVEQAYQDSNKAMDALMAALKSAGLADKDIKTTQYSINPIRRVTAGEETITGYRVTNQVSAKIRPIAQAGSTLSKVVAAAGNATKVQSIQFTLDEPAKQQSQLRDLAMADAKAKADQLAKLGGLKLGAPTLIQEGGGSPSPRALEFAAPAARAVGGDAPISPGELELRLTLNVTYAAAP